MKLWPVLTQIAALDAELFHPAWSIESIVKEWENPFVIFLANIENAFKPSIVRIDENFERNPSSLGMMDEQIIFVKNSSEEQSTNANGYLIAHYYPIEQIAEIYRIGVVKKHQGNGIGLLLIKFLEREMEKIQRYLLQFKRETQNSSFLHKKAILSEDLKEEVLQNISQKIQLEVASDNASALRLYEKAGFQKTGLRKKYYQREIDAILMEKSINRVFFER